MNMRAEHPKYPPNWLPQRNRPLPPAEELPNMTVAESVQSRFYPAMSGPGSDFDVFMVVATRGGPKEPAAGDASVCEPLRPPARGGSGGRTPYLHCDVYAEDGDLLLWGERPPKLEVGEDWEWAPGQVNPVWRNYMPTGRDLQFVQQLHDIWRCHEAVRMRELRTGVRYTHIVRSRPDVAFYAPVTTPLAELDYGTNEAPLVLSTARSTCCCGNDDWFNVGRRDIMEVFMTRFLHLQAVKFPLYASTWRAEDYARAVLDTMHAELREDARLTACLLKPTDRLMPGEP